MADSRILQLILTLKDEASKSLNEFSKRMETSVDASQKVAKGLSLVSLATVAVGGFAFKAASDLQQTNIAFTTMLGSAEKAQKFVEEMKNFARTTPLETSDIAQASQTLLAFGIDANKVLPNLRMIGDVALGDKEKFKSLSLAFAQVQSTGKLMGQDLLQMVNQGFNPLQIMSEQTGKSMAVLKDEMSKGAISADQVTEAFKIATSEGNRFFGGMDSQSKSFKGKMSTIKDDLKLILEENIGGPLLEGFMKILPTIEEFIKKLPELIEKIKNVGKFFEEHKVLLYVVAGAILGALVPAIWASVVAFAGLAIALAPFIIGGAIIGGIVAGIVWIVKNWEIISQKAKEIWGAIRDFIGGVFTKIKDYVTTTTENIKNSFLTGLGIIRDFFVNIWTSIVSFFQSSIQNIVSIAQSIWGSITAVFSAVWGVILNIFKFSIAFIVGFVIEAFNVMGIDIVSVFNNVVTWIKDAWNSVLKFTSEILTATFEWIKTRLNEFVSLWTDVWNAVSTFFVNIWNTMTTFISSGWEWISSLFMTGLQVISELWNTVWTAISTFFGGIWTSIKGTVSAGWAWIKEKFTTLADPVKDAWNNMWQGVSNITTSVFEGIKNTVKSSINWIIEKINTFIRAANSLAQSGAGAVGLSIPSIPEIPMLAKGGIVNKPTLAMVGENGPEAVIPLSRRNNPNGFGMGGITINITGNSISNSMDLNNIADRVSDAIMSRMRLSGQIS